MGVGFLFDSVTRCSVIRCSVVISMELFYPCGKVKSMGTRVDLCLTTFGSSVEFLKVCCSFDILIN